MWAEKKKPGTDCLHILSSPTISGFLEIWKFPYNMLCYTNFHDASQLLPCEKFLPMTMHAFVDDEGAIKAISSLFTRIIHVSVRSS